MNTKLHIRLIIMISALGLLSFRSANAPYHIGDFSLRSTDGKNVSLGSYKNSKGLIIVFTCNHCPFAKKYQGRLNDLNQKYSAKGFPLVAISSNDAVALPADSYEKMKERAVQEHYNFPYLFDETQSVARAFGAVKTPQVFILAKQKDNWVLKYSGAIDDNGAEPEKAAQHYAQDAVEALLAGEEIKITETKSIGCPIKWKNS